MKQPLIQIDERMYSIKEVAELIGHRPNYVRALIRTRRLEAVRPTGPNGEKGTWSIYPSAVREHLHAPDHRAERKARRAKREAQAEIEAARRLGISRR